MTSILLVVPILLCSVGILNAGQHPVTSPDGTVIVEVSDEGGLSYQVCVDGQEIVSPSQSGLEFAGGVGQGPSRAEVEALTAYTITTLTNGKECHFVVIASNERGESKPSNFMNAVPTP